MHGFLFFGFILQTIGLTLTTASKSAFITGMMVVVVPFLQVIIERRLPRLGNIPVSRSERVGRAIVGHVCRCGPKRPRDQRRQSDYSIYQRSRFGQNQESVAPPPAT